MGDKGYIKWTIFTVKLQASFIRLFSILRSKPFSGSRRKNNIRLTGTRIPVSDKKNGVNLV